MRITVKSGLARVFTVAHYSIGALMVLLIAFCGLTDKAWSWFTPLWMLGLYYWALETAAFGSLIGNEFVKRPLLVGAELLWLDLCVAALLGGIYLKTEYSEAHPLTWLAFVGGVWLVVAVGALVAWLTVAWVLRGFVSR